MKPILEKKNIINAINKASKILNNSDLVIFPTETVYGIGGNALSSTAIYKIYKIKKRPSYNPLICHFSTLERIENEFHINDIGYKLADYFWPGPLTLILKKKKNSKISTLVSNNNDFVACRIPSHPIANKLLELVTFPIAAPSANLNTKISSTNISHIKKIFKENIFYIDGGECKFGLESTVINLTKEKPIILRYGSIAMEDLKKIIPNLEYKKNNKKKYISPGMTKKHYSPNIPLRINIKKVLKEEVLLNFGKNNLKSDIQELNLSISGNLEEAAKNFYNYLHKLDKSQYKKIAVAPIPNKYLGKTINDRLMRAVSKCK